jgi:hypothetical protein
MMGSRRTSRARGARAPLHVRTRLPGALMLAVLALAACNDSDDPPPSTGNPPVVEPPPKVDPEVLASEPKLSGTPLNTIVATQLLPKIDGLFAKLVAEKKDIAIDGTKAFGGGDKFLPGKIAIGFSYLLLNTPKTDPKFAATLAGYRQIADLTIDEVNDTWGIYYYMSALVKLKNAGLLDQAVAPATLDKLKTKLDWRLFVNLPDYTLKNLPTNYYGVAFSIARLRHLMGWEDTTGADNLLAKLINHYEQYSGQYGFSDETDGEGRFDRYSVLLIGEICQRLIETGMDATPQLKGWLRKSVDVILERLNPAGNGVDYGRSLGPYADTAFTEVLSAAAHLDVLTPDEKTIAYAFATRIAAKYVETCYDADMQSVNLWEKGRRADGYRGKNRILGENLSLAHQLLYTNMLWNHDGFQDKVPMSTADFVKYLGTLPQSTVTWFAKGEYDRVLATYRDGLRIISLPMVNGGPSYHDKNPYFAVPHSYNLLSGAPDSTYPHLQPMFTAADGTKMIPAAYIKNVRTQENGKVLTVTYQQSEMDRVGKSTPTKDTRLASTTTYTFEPGQITRVDTYTPSAPLPLTGIALEFASFSTDAVAAGNSFTYGKGDVTGFTLSGLDTCAAKSVADDAAYRSPTGALQTSIVCTTGPITLTQPLTIKWVLKYRSPSVASFLPR